ncbi:MAG: ribosomal protein S18-alanine N-acetyltransferase [Myxococcota bacterium]|nr:ribosomal protein S18-alanine N-acetyltransferase [Myxococcota bacterium]
MKPREAHPGDLDLLFHLCEEVRPGSWSRVRLRDELAREDAWILCVETSGNEGLRVVGLLLARSVVGEVEILDVAVAEDFRRRGLGRSLLSSLLARAREESATRVLLEVRASNQAAQSLYSKHGFVVEGRRARYYPDGEDALLMTQHTSNRTVRPAPVRAEAEVLENVAEGGGNYRLSLAVPHWPGASPGQFLMLSAGAWTDVSRTDPLLPRPMAVFRQSPMDSDRVRVETLYKTVGRGSDLLAQAQVGQRIRVVGPLGGSFPLPSPGERAILVGGGTGTASLYELAAQAAQTSEVDVILGARSEQDLMGVSLFQDLGVRVHTTTEDGSHGTRGRVTDLIPELARESPQSCSLYACGPTPMMRACARLAEELGVPRCWVSLENTMACGFGVCLGCAVPLSEGGFSLLCRVGPVYSASEISWEGLP